MREWQIVVKVYAGAALGAGGLCLALLDDPSLAGWPLAVGGLLLILSTIGEK